MRLRFKLKFDNICRHKIKCCFNCRFSCCRDYTDYSYTFYNLVYKKEKAATQTQVLTGSSWLILLRKWIQSKSIPLVKCSEGRHEEIRRKPKIRTDATRKPIHLVRKQNRGRSRPHLRHTHHEGIRELKLAANRGTHRTVSSRVLIRINQWKLNLKFRNW